MPRATPGGWVVLATLLLSGCATAARSSSATAVATPPAATTAAPPVAPASLATAERLEHQGKLADARAAYLDVLRQQPEHAACLHRLGVVCTQMDDHASAAEYYNRALALGAQDAELLTDAGYSCYLRGEYEAAERLLTAAVEQSPEHVRAVNNLALVQGMTGRLEESLATFWRVNEPVEAWKNMAFVHQQRAEWAQAVACYREAQRLDPRVAPPRALTAKLAETSPRPGTPPVVLARSSSTRPPDADTGIETADDVFEAPEAVDTGDEDPALPPELPVEEDSGPFELPEMIDASVSGTPQAQVATPPMQPVSLPIVTPAWTREAPLPAVEERPWKRGATLDPFDVVYSREDDLAPEPVSSTTIALAGAEWAEADVDENSPSPALTPEPPSVDAADGLTLANCCLVALFEERRFVAGRPEHPIEYDRHRFLFSTAEAAQKFAADPQQYLPAAMGLDVVAVRRQAAAVNGSLEHATWFRGRLYLFASAGNLTAFQAHPYRYIEYQ